MYKRQRQDNAAASLYNIVGFQTHLKWGEQKRVFQMIPGLENAEFVRYGVMPVSYTHLDVYKRQISYRLQRDLERSGYGDHIAVHLHFEQIR